MDCFPVTCVTTSASREGEEPSLESSRTTDFQPYTPAKHDDVLLNVDSRSMGNVLL